MAQIRSLNPNDILTVAASKNAALRTDLDHAHAVILQTSIANALIDAGVTKEGSDLVGERLSKRVKFEMLDGERVIAVMQADGESPMAGSGPGGRATVDDLAKEAAVKFPSMFQQKGDPVGGAPPKTAIVQEGKTMARKEFDTLSAPERMAKMKAGYKLVDTGGGGPPKTAIVQEGKTMARKEFDTLSAPERMAKMKAGYKLVD